MAKFGTAYVEIKPDLSAFGAGLGKEIEARLGEIDVSQDVDRKLRPRFGGLGRSLSEALGQGLGPEFEKAVTQATDAVKNVPRRSTSEIDLNIRQALAQAAELRATLADLNRQKATPEVKAKTEQAKLALDEIQVRLARLRAEKAEVKVDVDRSFFSRLGGVSSSIGDALRGIAVSAGGLFGIGGALTGLADAAAAALPIVAALAVGIGVLVASFGAAVAGAGALGIALAGALGPAALVAFAALTKIALIVKAIHDDSKNSASTLQAVANAQDQVKSATENVAASQDNLRQQTTAAYQAWQDSIEAVKDDLLAVQDAQLGIADAQLSLKEATLALKEFKAQAPGLDSLFKKFTNVDVDLSGLNKALDAARKASGGKLSQDDTLKLERLILNVRRAKLGEKQATDRLHDANVNLARDRQTEVRYLQQGIRAYPGYTAAVRGAAQAQRSLAAAERASATAATARAGAIAKLTPVEQKLAATFKLISGAFNRAFSPALDALFAGVNRGLRTFVRILADPRIVRALSGIGAAMGGAFAGFARLLATKQMRDAFVVLARGAANLIRVVGGKAFPAFFKILTAIARAAMPQLVGLFGSLADTLDRWAKWIDKHPEEFRKRIVDLVGTFKQWLDSIIAVGGFLLDLGGTLKGLGDAMGRAFRDSKQAISSLFADPGDALARALGLTDGAARNLRGTFSILGSVMRAVVSSTVPVFTAAFDAIRTALRGFVEVVAGIIQGDFKGAWHGVVDVVKGALKLALTALKFFTAPFRAAGKLLGVNFTDALRGALNVVKSVAISIVNFVIGLVNKISFKVPGIIPGVGGHHVGIHIDPIDTAPKKKPNLNPQGLPTLTKTPVRAKASSVEGRTVNIGAVNLSAPAAAVPDPQSAGLRFVRLVDALG